MTKSTHLLTFSDLTMESVFFPSFPKPALPPIARLLFKQFRVCGPLYSLKKYLLIVFRLVLPAHLAVTRSLALPLTSALAKHHPRQSFKYLNKYLALSFSTRARAMIMANHYQFLSGVASDVFFDWICQGHISLWEETVDEHLYTIELTFPKNEEGELFLVFCMNSCRLFTLSFTIAPGSLLNVEEDQVVFIGRLQGVANQREAIRQAGKAFHDVNPQALLLAAVRGIATSLNISGIVGVSAMNQICKDRTPCAEASRAAYDDFYISAGGTALGNDYYFLSSTPVEKPLSEIKNNHRSRVKRKREIRNAITEQVSSVFKMKCLSSPLHSEQPQAA